MTEEITPHDQPGEATPQTAEDFVQAGWRHYAAGDYAEAEVDFRQALQLDGSRADAYYGMAMAFIRSGNEMEGVQLLEKAKAVNAEPGNSQEARHRTMLNLVINSQIAILNRDKSGGA